MSRALLLSSSALVRSLSDIQESSLNSMPGAETSSSESRAGGHTHEMLSVLRLLDRRRYIRRVYVHGAGDGMSVRKAAALELELAREDADAQDGRQKRSSEAIELVELPRARAVGQPLWSAGQSMGGLRLRQQAQPPSLTTDCPLLVDG